MVFYASIVLVLVVLGGSFFVVGSDLFRRPAGHRLDGLKEWQQLVGAVLGFMGAAGVLVLGTAIESEQSRQNGLEREHAIGLALAYEAERLSNEIAGNLGIVNIIRAEPPGQDFARTCRNFILSLSNSLDKEKPVWRAALAQMVEFGDENLQLFVRYHGLYDDIVHDVRNFNQAFCDQYGEAQINEFARRLEVAFDFYRDIAAIYDTALVEPAPAVPVQTPAPVEAPVVVPEVVQPTSTAN